MLATKSNNKMIVKFLIEQKELNINVNAISKNSLTALFVAIQECNMDIFKYLLEHGAYINYQIYKINAVDMAVLFDSLEIAIYLIKTLGMIPNSFMKDDIFLNSSDYGYHLDKNNLPSSNPLNISFRRRLTNDEKVSRVEILIQARKSYLNWKRRWPYMKVFVGHKFILMASVRKALEATALPSNVKIPNLASRTRLQKYSNLRNKIFGSYILYLIIEFL